MVRVVVAGASSHVGRYVVEELAHQGKHEVTAFTRQDTIGYEAHGVKVTKILDYADRLELVHKLKGVDTVLSFISPIDDAHGEAQKSLVDAAVEVGVKRFAPSEWGSVSNSGIPIFASKDVVLQHLQDMNRERKVIEYGLFQSGIFTEYFVHPYSSSRLATSSPFFDFGNTRSILLEDNSSPFSLTSIVDFAKVVALAVDSEEPWPLRSGFYGEKLTPLEIVKIAERVTGQPFKIDYIKVSDLLAGKWTPDWMPYFEVPPGEWSEAQLEAMKIQYCCACGLALQKNIFDTSNEWNERLPGYKFMKLEQLMAEAWERREKSRLECQNGI